MKFSSIAAISSLFLLSVNAQSRVPLEITFKKHSHKNIAFFASFGGSSHYTWVLNIVNELGERGHNTYFITGESDMRYGQPYSSNIKTVSVGKSIEVPEEMFEGGSALLDEYPTIFLSKAMKLVNTYIERDYNYTKNFFIENKIDVAICDHFGDSCVEAAKTLGIPFIISCAIDPTDDSAAPYVNNKFTTMYDFSTEFQSFWERFRNKFINPLRDIYYLIPVVNEINNRKIAIGIDAKMEDPTAQWKDALKLINIFPGYAPARPLGPLVEFVGPILPKTYTPLGDEIKSFLDNHKHVALIAFGQHVSATKDELKFVLTALLENLENGSLDGILWATGDSDVVFSETVTTSSGATYKVQDFINGLNPHVYATRWAPQTAILLHSSTTVFVSHGGLGSWFESMYAGTRMVMFPFVNDQPGNSLTIERSNLGGIMRYKSSPKEAAAVVKKVAEDKDGEIQKNVDRFQALTQIHSEHGVIRAADLVEEVAYAHVNGKLPHRESADRRMSYLKGNNYDLYGALVAILFASFYAVVFGAKKLIALKKTASNEKLKKL